MALFDRPTDATATRVLDVGCGNGRFAHFLVDGHPVGPLDYMGIDQSRELLAIGEGQCAGSKGDRLRWLHFDLTSDDVESSLRDEPYHLVVAFGLLHHIPSLEYRRKLIAALSSWTCLGGTLIFTLWRFDRSERFRKKIISWQEYNQQAEEEIDTGELEAGDYLMSFGDTGGTARYCHAPTENEVGALTESLGLKRIAQFEADGKTQDLNEYHVFSKSEAS